MRIGIVAPPWFEVPPEGYGGIEAVVALLADGLADVGHEVTLVAAGRSRTTGRLLLTSEEAHADRLFEAAPDLDHSLQALEVADRFDIVNDHSGLIGAAFCGLWPIPSCHTVHCRIDGEAGVIYRRLARTVPALRLISISRSQRQPLPGLPWIANCPNAIDLDAYPIGDGRGEYLLFLGRLYPDKGAARAIDVADRLGLPLKIAGKCREPIERAYFDEEIAPRLSSRIEWLGEVSHAEKIDLLRGARCTLFPISWPEPFGLVMAESLACGTPVVATRHGAVPEVLGLHGEGGIVVDQVRDLPDAVETAFAIDRSTCRRYAERMFSPNRMVADYLTAFEDVLAETPQSAAMATRV
jgi:glycosyltransferase involved in cell wall biosynthesis